MNAACVAFSKAMADIGKTDGVQVNSINPGRVETDRLWRRFRETMKSTGRGEDAVREEYRQEFGISRFGKVEDLGSLIAFLTRRTAAGCTARRSTSTAARSARSELTMNILLTPARIGPAEIPNRIVMPPMTTRGSDAEGYVTDQTIAYYMARVRGGVGLITVEMASPEKAGRHRRRELGIYDDEFIPA